MPASGEGCRRPPLDARRGPHTPAMPHPRGRRQQDRVVDGWEPAEGRSMLQSGGQAPSPPLVPRRTLTSVRVGDGELSQSTSSQWPRGQSAAQMLMRWSELAASHRSAPSAPKSPCWGWVRAGGCLLPCPTQSPSPASILPARPCRLMKPRHLFVCALDGGDQSTSVITQHTEGHPRAGAAHSHKPILVSREDGLTWARQGHSVTLWAPGPQPRRVPTLSLCWSPLLTICRVGHGRQGSPMGVHLELHGNSGDAEDTQRAITVACCHLLLLRVSTGGGAPRQTEAALGTHSGETRALPWGWGTGAQPQGWDGHSGRTWRPGRAGRWSGLGPGLL